MLQKVFNTALLASLFLLLSFGKKNDFKDAQLKSGRVKAAYQKHWAELKQLLQAQDIDPGSFDVHLRAFKQEGQLEAWVKKTGAETYTLLKRFAICAASGGPGPKRRQGDGQVPEGFYSIPSLHPYSSYHLALKVGYPNKSDHIKATAPDPGGDIMIHGNCVTIGCLPLQDEPVEELYILCVEAMSRGRSVTCHIYPCRLSTANKAGLEKNAAAETVLFWSSLKKAYDYFELNHSLPQISITAKGDYVVIPQ